MPTRLKSLVSIKFNFAQLDELISFSECCYRYSILIIIFVAL